MPIVIRPSSLPSWPDCARRTAARTPVPQILSEPASIAPPLIEGWEALMESYRRALSDSFAGAMKP